MNPTDLPQKYQQQIAMTKGHAAFVPHAPKKRGPAKDLFAKAQKKLLRDALVNQFWLDNGIPVPIAEFRFHATRMWRFDFAFVDKKLALEVEGGVWTGGRHTRGAGFLGDMDKYNAATLLGWRVLRVTPTSLMTANTADMLKRAMEILP